MSQANSQFMQGVLNFVGLSSFAVKRAADELNVHRLGQKKAADLRGPMVEHLIQTGMVAPTMRKQAEEMLASHEQTMHLLKAAVDRLLEANVAKAKQASDLGAAAPDPEVAAPYDGSWSLTDNRLGRHTTEKKASDLALLRVLESPAR